MQLLTPIALLASAAVIIPVLIHLWNIRKGKTLKVGSIFLLAQSSRQPARSRKITNWPLFLLRCLLLLLLALFLADPYSKPGKSGQAAGWMVMPAQQLHQVYEQQGGLIDSLLAAGFELRDLSPDFTPMTLSDSASLRNQDPAGTSPSPWALLQLLDSRVPSGIQVYAFCSNQLKDYYGERPSVRTNLHWIGFSPASTNPDDFIYSFLNNEGEIRTVKWKSSANGNALVKDSLAITAQPDTASIHVTIYPDNNNTDARYLQAAIEAIGQYTERRIVFDAPSPGKPQDLICWLREEEPSDDLVSLLSKNGTLLLYDHGAGDQIAQPFSTGHISVASSRDPFVYRYRPGTASGQVLWTLADGRPLLSMEDANGKRILHFKSRFNPQWTDLVWEEAFVRSLIPLVLPPFPMPDIDKRMIDPSQAKPKQAVNGKPSIRHSVRQTGTSLRFPFWIGLLLVFIAERLLTYYPVKKRTDK